MGKRLTEFLVHKPQDKTHRILTSSVETISTLFMTYRGLKKNLLPLFYIKTKILTRENIRLSSLFAAVDVSFLRAKRPSGSDPIRYPREVWERAGDRTFSVYISW